MTPFRVIIAMTVVTAFVLLHDYQQHAVRTNPFDLSRTRTVTKINGVPAGQVPGTLNGASGMFKQRLAPLEGGASVTALLYPSGRSSAGTESPAPSPIAPPTTPAQVATR
jgi:hypothetical protein